MTTKRDQHYWQLQLDQLIDHYSADPVEQALYARGLLTAWLARLAQEYPSVGWEITARIQKK